MNKRFNLMILMAGGAALAACSNISVDEDYGAVEVTASAPTITKEFTTIDGWVVKYDRFLVSVSANRRAQPWDTFTFQIAPAVETEGSTTTLAEAVKESDRDLMTKGGFSIYLEAKARKAGVTKTIKWGFTTDTSFSECEGERGGVKVKGIVVPPDGSESVDLAFRGDVLFSDDLSAPGIGLRFDTLAAADSDMNGEVTLEELRATKLDAARAFGPYGTAKEKDIADLGAFTGALTRSIVASFREKGSCVAAPTPAATP